MTESHPACQYCAGERMLTVMRPDQVDTLIGLLATLKSHGFGEVQIVVRDGGVITFRLVEVHK